MCLYELAEPPKCHAHKKREKKGCVKGKAEEKRLFSKNQKEISAVESESTVGPTFMASDCWRECIHVLHSSCLSGVKGHHAFDKSTDLHSVSVVHQFQTCPSNLVCCGSK